MRAAANFVRWHLAGTLVLATVAASGQTPNCAETKQSQAERNLQDFELRERAKWFLQSTIGAQSLAGGLFSAGFGTAIDSPKEYGSHWEGYGKRYGMRLTGVS